MVVLLTAFSREASIPDPLRHRRATAAITPCLVLDAEYAEGLAEFAKDYGMAPYTFRYPDIGRWKLNFLDLVIEMIDALRSAAFDTVNQKARYLGTPVGPS